MSASVQTVTGTATPDELGRTLIHEHVLVGFPGWDLDAKAPPFERAEVRSMLAVPLQGATTDQGSFNFASLIASFQPS